MTQRWLRTSLAALTLAAVFAGLAGGCSAKQDEGTPGAPTADQAKASQQAGERAAAGAQSQGAAAAAQHH